METYLSAKTAATWAAMRRRWVTIVCKSMTANIPCHVLVSGGKKRMSGRASPLESNKSAV